MSEKMVKADLRYRGYFKRSKIFFVKSKMSARPRPATKVTSMYGMA